jgi:hypothetical protein
VSLRESYRVSVSSKPASSIVWRTDVGVTIRRVVPQAWQRLFSSISALRPAEVRKSNPVRSISSVVGVGASDSLSSISHVGRVTMSTSPRAWTTTSPGCGRVVSRLFMIAQPGRLRRLGVVFRVIKHLSYVDCL